MFVKETKVKRSGREYSYLQLVEGYRDENGKVRHRVVANLGRKDALKDSGQLEALAGSFARLDPPMAGTRRSVVERRLNPAWRGRPRWSWPGSRWWGWQAWCVSERVRALPPSWPLSGGLSWMPEVAPDVDRMRRADAGRG